MAGTFGATLLESDRRMAVRVEIVPCLRDNYAYVLIDEATREAVVIDPSEAVPIERAIEAAGVRLTHLWATHHHHDHVGGAEALARCHDVRLLVHEVDAAHVRALGPRIDVAKDTDRWSFHGATIELLHVPGHTLGAAAFAVTQPEALPWIFTGDTLFLGGCGRVFEGTAAMLRASVERIAGFAPESLVYCGHEYTEANLQFARVVEPENEAVVEALARAKAATCTVPGRMTIERVVNPFLRAQEPSARRFAEGHACDAIDSADAVFATLRSAKNNFRAS